MLSPYIPENEFLADVVKYEPRQLSMFIGVYTGLKPLMDTFITYDRFTALRDICKGEGIIVDHNGIMAGIPRETLLKRKEKLRDLGTTKLALLPFNPELKDAYVHTFISRSRDYIEQAQSLTWYNLFIGNKQYSQPAIDNYRYGRTLGFPDCCIKFYSGHNGRYFDGKKAWAWNTPWEVFKNTKGAPSFYCNHIPMDHFYFLIHHYPCSYNCEATIKLAKSLLEAIRSVEPGFAEGIERTLKFPYLIFDEKKAFVLKGRIEGNTVHYSDRYFLGDGRDIRHYKEIFHGDRITLDDGRVRVFDGKELIIEYPDDKLHQGRLMQFE